MKTNMHFGASPAIFKLAKALRKHPTPAEEKLWEHLRKHQIGHRFRQQHPMWNYVVDFYCPNLKLAIEADGEIHMLPENQETDKEKEEGLRSLGVHLLRFKNHEILNNIDEVLSSIYAKIIEIRNGNT